MRCDDRPASDVAAADAATNRFGWNAELANLFVAEKKGAVVAGLHAHERFAAERFDEGRKFNALEDGRDVARKQRPFGADAEIVLIDGERA